VVSGQLLDLARMAELVDAADSKSAVRKDVQVRFLFWALGLIIYKSPLNWAL
jgi:hypothetical protein